MFLNRLVMFANMNKKVGCVPHGGPDAPPCTRWAGRARRGPCQGRHRPCRKLDTSSPIPTFEASGRTLGALHQDKIMLANMTVMFAYRGVRLAHTPHAHDDGRVIVDVFLERTPIVMGVLVDVPRRPGEVHVRPIGRLIRTDLGPQLWPLHEELTDEGRRERLQVLVPPAVRSCLRT